MTEEEWRKSTDPQLAWLRGLASGLKLDLTNSEWLAFTDPQPMLHFLIGSSFPRVQDLETFPSCKGSARKLRLFACACYHRIRHLLPNTLADAAVEVAERVADGILSAVELERATAGLRETLDSLEERWRASRGTEHIALSPTHEALALGLQIVWTEAQKAAYYASSTAYYAVASIAYPDAPCGSSAMAGKQIAEKRVQTNLLRDIFGNLFHSTALDPSWLTWNGGKISNIAKAIFEKRAFDRLPFLADALQEAGCDNEDILNHCRQPGVHVRGCWVVDLLLGKE